MADLFERNKIETIRLSLSPESTFSDVSFWLFIVISIIVVIYRIYVQRDLLSQEQNFFDSLRKPDMLLPFWAFDIMFGLVIVLIGYSIFRMIRISRRGEAKRLINSLFILMLMHYLLYTMAIFSHKNFLSALVTAIISMYTAIVLLSITILVDKVAAILLLINVIWSAYLTYITYLFIELNPDLKQAPEPEINPINIPVLKEDDHEYWCDY